MNQTKEEIKITPKMKSILRALRNGLRLAYDHRERLGYYLSCSENRCEYEYYCADKVVISLSRLGLSRKLMLSLPYGH